MTEPEIIDQDENVLNVLFTETGCQGKYCRRRHQQREFRTAEIFHTRPAKELKGKKVRLHCLQLKNHSDADKLEMMLQDLVLPKMKEAASKYFKLDIAKIGLIEKELKNFSVFFQNMGIKTLDELKETLKAEVAQYWEGQSLNQLHDQLYHFC